MKAPKKAITIIDAIHDKDVFGSLCLHSLALQPGYHGSHG
jgi:hypothetical protein